jgi:hypothetical protein
MLKLLHCCRRRAVDHVKRKDKSKDDLPPRPMAKAMPRCRTATASGGPPRIMAKAMPHCLPATASGGSSKGQWAAGGGGSSSKGQWSKGCQGALPAAAGGGGSSSSKGQGPKGCAGGGGSSSGSSSSSSSSKGQYPTGTHQWPRDSAGRMP